MSTVVDCLPYSLGSFANVCPLDGTADFVHRAEVSSLPTLSNRKSDKHHLLPRDSLGILGRSRVGFLMHLRCFDGETYK